MGTSVSRACTAHARTIFAALAAFTLTLGLAPMAFAAEDSVAASSAQVDSVAGPLAGPGYEGDARSASPNSDLLTVAEGPILAGTLAGSATSIVSADVALDASDPIVGSFTVDGLTYALNDGKATLISVGATFVVAPYEGSADSGDGNAIAIPASVTYNDVAYPVTSIGPYAFYLSGATSVALPASVASVDDRAFRSSDVARVEVDPDNPNLTSFDGCLYDSQLLSLLLIPEGRAGAVLLPETAEVAQASKFSHCSLVDAISVEEGGAAFASWDGLLYDASGTTLLRVPAGATDITIRDGCTAIAAGVMEGCAKLERINAPASVTSISPDLFESVPTISLPIASALQDGSQDDSAAGPLAGPGYEGDARSASADSAQAEGEARASSSAAPQLTAMVALSSADDDLPEVSPSSIEVLLPEGADAACWQAAGLVVSGKRLEAASAQAAATSHAGEVVYFQNRLDQAITFDYRHYEGASTGGLTTIGAGQTGSLGLYGGTDYAVDVSGNNNAVFLYLDYSTNAYPRYTTSVIPMGDVTVDGWSIDRFYNESGSGWPAQAGKTVVIWPERISFDVTWDGAGGTWADGSASKVSKGATDQLAPLSGPSAGIPARLGCRFAGWAQSPDAGAASSEVEVSAAASIFYAQWEPYEIGFDVDSEPGDADYPGTPKDPVSGDAAGPDGTIQIEDPKRPGYVFEGWVIPSGGGTEAVDQDLVYQGSDGKWYVDASKLPGYAGDDGRVELTARWTSVISVDVPSSVTFYADLVTQGQESREGAASNAFGQSKVANQSQVDLRVVGLESSAVKTEGPTLGADSILKKADAATPSSSTQKLLSLYPSAKAWTADELQDPDAVGGSKATTAVDFDLDDVLLERSFKADDFTIAAGDTLNMGYRLNLFETGQQLDYDKLSTLAEGQSASIANVSYCFAADYGPVFWTLDDDGSTLDVFAIKADAEKISAGDAATTAKYTAWMKEDHPFHIKWFEKDLSEAAGGDYSIYDVRIIGLNHDDKADGSGKAGITFQFAELLNGGMNGKSGWFMNGSNYASGWGGSWLRAALQSRNESHPGHCTPQKVWDAIVPVVKRYRTSSQILDTLALGGDRLFLPSYSEIVAEQPYLAPSSYPAGTIWASPQEGGTYSYYQLKGTKNAVPNEALVAHYQDPSQGSRGFAWLRSSYYSGNVQALVCNTGIGNPSGNDYVSSYYSMLPCFCF